MDNQELLNKIKLYEDKILLLFYTEIIVEHLK